ncbi:MAG: hypothetical protein ACKONH_08205 [Planctomycetia bacterium]
MQPARVVVFLPCHTLDDFPTWLEEAEADDVLACWTAAWDPRLLAAVGRAPEWASVDQRPPDADPILGLVPAAIDPRFAAQADAVCTAGSRWVRGTRGLAAVAAAAVDAAGAGGVGPTLLDDFRALGLAVLLAELLARRMRSEAGLEATDFGTTAVAAARAAVAGRDDEARDRLRECFGFLAATRARYYPVDLWLVDLVLLGETTLGRPLVEELSLPTPLGVVASGSLVERLASDHPESLAALQARCADGSVVPCGGRDEDGALALETPEEVLASFVRGRAAWQRHVGTVPLTFARVGGGGSPLVPEVLAGFGYLGSVWPLFDGTPLPDPGAGRIRWEGNGDAAIDAVARPPVDARAARSILGLPERLGDAMDHDHVAVVTFARYAGTASPWHTLLRRIGSWGDVLGTFVTPDELFRRTPGGGTPVAFEPDAFPVPQPAAAVDPLAGPVERAAETARRIVAAADAVRPLLAVTTTPASVGPRSGPRRTSRWPWSRRAPDQLAIDNGLVRLEAHRRTGGLLSLRRPSDRANRLSQQIAPRTTQPPAAPGSSWESPEERAEHGWMQSEAVVLVKTADGADCIESRGRLFAADGRDRGSFMQRMSLVPGLPLAVLDLELSLDAAAPGTLWEEHVACRFAWHENEDVDLFRSLHTQPIATARTRFSAPHFILVRGGRAAGNGDVAILTGGLPWHVRSSPHVLDTILCGAASGVVSRRLAIGIGLARPWDAALRLLAGGSWDRPTGPEGVRITVEAVERVASGRMRLKIGLLESAGRSGHVRIDWAREPLAAEARDLADRPRGDMTVAIEGKTTVVFLKRFEWLRLHLELPA